MRPFSYDTSQGGTTFSDPDGDALTYFVSVPYPFGDIGRAPPYMAGIPSGPGQATVQVIAFDGRGGAESDSFVLTIVENLAPVVSKPNEPLVTVVGAHINYDLAQGGSTFVDVEGDRLSYALSFVSPSQEFSIDGTRLIGSTRSAGVITVRITADDGYGGINSDVMTVAVAAPEPGRPVLPAITYLYADTSVNLPALFREATQPAYGDTTPNDNRTTDAGATLGRVLFYDKRLSITNTHSCATCHRQENGFAAPDRFSTGVSGVAQKRNTMGLSNVRYNREGGYFIDARERSLERLALAPIQEPTELANFLPLLERKLGATDFYPALFAAAFGTPEIDSARIGKAIAQFLRSLMAFQSKYDRVYNGLNYETPRPELVFTGEEIRGHDLFNAHCARCHGDPIQTLWVPTTNGLDAMPLDVGAGRSWGYPPSGAAYRVASLRNVARTAPYMHDGRFATLREVIDHYDHGVQRPEPQNMFRLPSALTVPGTTEPKVLNLPESDKTALEAFLHTLTDEAFLTDARFADPFH